MAPTPSTPHTLSRRDLLRLLASVVAMAPGVEAMQRPGPHGIPLRPLGKTGIHLPIIGYGGWDAVANKNDEESIRLMHEGIDLGLTFFDNAWEYHNGRAEEVMGRALAVDGKRQKVFLMTKVCARDYEGAKRQIDESLRRLRTDHVDLLQFHSIQYAGDRERIFDPEKGAMKAAQEAKKAGKLRFLGFSGHMDPKEHLGMFATDFAWNTVQMPLNILDAHFLSFQQRVLPEATKRGISVLGMKSLAGQDGRIARDLNVSWELCRRYAMSLPVTAVICGMQTREEVQGMARIGRGFQPLSATEVEQLLSKSREAAKDGHIEAYKDRSSGYGCSYHSRVLKA